MLNAGTTTNADTPEPEVRTVRATRYVTPLREGGSLPAIVEGDDLGTYVLKFRGAGQGPKVLIAELLTGEIGRALGLPIPEIVLMEVDPALGRSEADPEIKALIEASIGLNLAMDFLPGSFAYDPRLAKPPDAYLASAIVWFDALITNVDRTVRNTNMLFWHRTLYLIDQGASLYFQYGGPDFVARSRNPFPAIGEHVLLPYATRLAEADDRLAPLLTAERLDALLALLPETWLSDPNFADPEAQRAAYRDYLLERLTPPRGFVEEAVRARDRLV